MKQKEFLKKKKKKKIYVTCYAELDFNKYYTICSHVWSQTKNVGDSCSLNSKYLFNVDVVHGLKPHAYFE